MARPYGVSWDTVRLITNPTDFDDRAAWIAWMNTATTGGIATASIITDHLEAHVLGEHEEPNYQEELSRGVEYKSGATFDRIFYGYGGLPSLALADREASETAAYWIALSKGLTNGAVVKYIGTYRGLALNFDEAAGPMVNAEKNAFYTRIRVQDDRGIDEGFFTTGAVGSPIT